MQISAGPEGGNVLVSNTAGLRSDQASFKSIRPSAVHRKRELEYILTLLVNRTLSVNRMEASIIK